MTINLASSNVESLEFWEQYPDYELSYGLSITSGAIENIEAFCN